MDKEAKGKPIIGLTGGIGSGKSLVARILAELGCGVIDADALAQQALDENPVANQLVDWWGNGVLGDDGRVNRRALADIVFDRPDQLRRLEQLTHPLIRPYRLELRQDYLADEKIRAIVEDCPLLIEVELDKECDTIIFVDTPRSLRSRRLAASRGWTEQDLARREKIQASLDTKAKRADHVVVNDASMTECFAHVRDVYLQILNG